jgi:tungstate transport system ATP-binding protein
MKMALVEIRGLSKSFGRSEVLKDINLDVQENEVLALIGPTGSGKTTLLRLIDLLDQPTSGHLFFEGVDICHLSSQNKLAMRRKMAMVFQKPVMFKTNVYDNVCYGLKVRGEGKARDEVLRVLKEVDLLGYESRDANTLSGGEMQRIALARAMVIKPQLLLLDEPTANLDPKSAQDIDSLIKRLANNGTTVIIASHNMLQCRRLADRIAVMANGTIPKVGLPQDILSDRGLFGEVKFEDLFIESTKF